MSRSPIKVLIVDDSPLVREMLCDALANKTDMLVIGVAESGEAALSLLEKLSPDVITLDLHMPKMDGLATLDAILARRPVPVIVVSSFAKRAAELTLQALDHGALDYVEKPSGLADAQKVYGEDLPQKIRNMAGADVTRVLRYRRLQSTRSKQPVKGKVGTVPPTSMRGCIALGISTGGPPALSTLLSALSPPLPPIVIVQHMPLRFTGLFAKRLDTLTSLEVKEAEQGDLLRSNQVLIAPGGTHLRLRRTTAKDVCIQLESGEPVSGHKPSVDVMMASAAKAYGEQCLGVIMTGMGRDGATGCKAIRDAGGYVLAQDEASSDVYGMNKVAFVEGHVDQQVSLGQMARAIVKRVQSTCSDAGKHKPGGVHVPTH